MKGRIHKDINVPVWNSKTTYPILWAFDFGQIPWYVGNLVGQMPCWLELQKASNHPPTR